MVAKLIKTKFLARFFTNLISFIGLVLVITSIILMLAILGVAWIGFDDAHTNPYRVIIVAPLSAARYQAVEFMDSTAVCGQVCHEVMQPEYVTYRNSPHSRVACVSCHIGPGASFSVKSKLPG